MGQALLVGPDLDVGRDAIAVLDEAGIDPAVALLAAFPEYSDWRFVLASPALDQKNLLRAHEQVAKAFRGEFVSRMPVTMVLRMKEPFVRALRRSFSKAKNVEGMRLGGQTIGDRFVDSAYVYRIR